MSRIAYRSRSHLRGTALLELMLCMTPYALIMIGAMYLWHLAAGKQEIYKYATSASTTANLPEAKMSEALKGDFEAGTVTTYDATSEDSFDSKADVDEEKDEPVLPYDVEGNDLAAALSRGTYRVRLNWDGTIDASLTQTGGQLRREGLISNVTTGNDLDVNSDLDFDIDMDVMQDISTSMRDWFVITSVEGTKYSYKPGSDGRLPLEEDADDWRRDTTTIGGGDATTQFGLYVTDPQLRGNYASGSDAVKLEDLPYHFEDRDGEDAIAPLDMPNPYLGSADSEFYSKDD